MLIHALSPVHAGTGQSIGAVDLPIARNRATEHPYIPGSSLKGSLRDVATSMSEANELESGLVAKVFGPDASESSDSAGAVAIGDANIIALPVRSIAGTFAWICSPYTITKFLRDLQDAGTQISIPNISLALDSCFVHEQNHLHVQVGGIRKVIFEDLDLTYTTTSEINTLIDAIGGVLFAGDDTWQRLFRQKCCIVSDDIFTFLSKNGTDVVTRIRISHETKVVEKGALWTEENLPTESVLYATVVSMPSKRSQMTNEKIFTTLNTIVKHPIQLGGKATIGRGRCKLNFVGGV